MPRHRDQVQWRRVVNWNFDFPQRDYSVRQVFLRGELLVRGPFDEVYLGDFGLKKIDYQYEFR